MGVIGTIIGQEVGGVGGREASGAIAKKLGAGKAGQEVARNIGSGVGRFLGAGLGALAPFETGGVVGKGRKRGTPIPILAHAGEVVIPLNAQATKAQMKIIRRDKRLHC
jgi:hypothetical protein